MIEHKFPYESFIGGWYISNSVCDDMIKVFHSSKLKKETIKGLQGKNGIPDINLNIKDSEDLIISHLDNDKEILNYREQLQLCLNEYVKKYPDANTLAKYNINSDYNIQYYLELVLTHFEYYIFAYYSNLMFYHKNKQYLQNNYGVGLIGELQQLNYLEYMLNLYQL